MSRMFALSVTKLGFSSSLRLLSTVVRLKSVLYICWLVSTTVIYFDVNLTRQNLRRISALGNLDHVSAELVASLSNVVPQDHIVTTRFRATSRGRAQRASCN